MADYVTMQNRIAREVRRASSAASSDIAQEIKDAIKTAIAYYQNERFWFNEKWDTATTAAGVQRYALPTGFIEFDDIRLEESGSSLYPLRRTPFNTILELTTHTAHTGRPQDYAIFANELWFWPIPDSEFTYYRYYLRELSTLSGDADTNAWMTSGEELIRLRAERELWMNVLHDDERAVSCALAEDAALARLRGRTEQQLSSGRIVGSYF